jgi:transposase-like protein
VGTAEMAVVEVDGVGVRREALAFPVAAGAMAMAAMPDEEFEERLATLRRGQDRIRRIQRELMVGPTPDNPEGEDYGVIPGTKKPTLLKPGAEKICSIYGLVPTFEPVWIEGDGVTSPHLRVRMTCSLHLGHSKGPIVGEGLGAANSWERKHRWRSADRACPSCGAEGTVRRSSYPNKGGRYVGEKGWWCKDCRTNWDDPAEPEIVEQQTGQIENKDPYEVENTLLKMAKKRAHVDATLTATATSGLFTQDVEDAPPPPPRTAPATASAHPQSAQPAPPQAPPAEEYPNDQQAYERHNVEPAAKTAAPASDIPPCPKGHSGSRVMFSKVPKNGRFYCKACAKPYGDPA